MKRNKHYEPYLICIMKWLRAVVIQSGLPHYPESLIKKYCRILRTRGRKEAIAFSKNARASLLQWLTTTESLDKSARISAKGKLPKDLKFLRHITELDYPSIRLILSALYASRGLELPPVINHQSITGKAIDLDLSRFFRDVIDFWNTLGYWHSQSIPKRVLWKKFHMSTKTGPNGHALWAALADYSVLPDSLKKSIKIIAGCKLSKRMELLDKYLSYLLPLFKVTGTRFRKVSAISDQEGKTREVAILDYWSQTALRGLHSFLYDILRKIPQDCTFNQGSFKDKIKKFENNGHLYHSVDLTAATDRFPIKLIGLVLRGRFTDDYVSSWRDIMVGYPFDTPSGKINYAVGNPMGAYSSWASFALAHHFVMFHCCRNLGMNWSDAPYVLLGDDIVIKHNDLAKNYMETMESLGVDFSIEKSHISPHMFEFAKRTFHMGTEITPFPLSALWSTRRSPSLMLNVLVNEESKGWSSLLGTPSNLSELYTYLGFSATYVAKKRKIFVLSYHLMEGLSGRTTAEQSINSILVEYYPGIIKRMKHRKHFCLSLFGEILQDSFLGSVTANKQSGKPLGVIAERFLIYITGCDELLMDVCDIIQAIPLLQIHGQVEEIYIKAMKGEMDQINLGLKQDWKLMLRAITIPVSDQIYYSRNQDLMIHASFTLAKYLRTRIEAYERSRNDIYQQPERRKFSDYF